MTLSLITISLSEDFHSFYAELVVQGVDSYFCPYFLAGIQYLLYHVSSKMYTKLISSVTCN